jgi:Fe-S cluster assembly scaffold protein SufB
MATGQVDDLANSEWEGLLADYDEWYEATVARLGARTSSSYASRIAHDGSIPLLSGQACGQRRCSGSRAAISCPRLVVGQARHRMEPRGQLLRLT